jgi:hypothetical protein
MAASSWSSEFGIELGEDTSKRARQGIGLGGGGRPTSAENPKIGLRVEERDFEAVAGRGMAMGLRNAMNQTLEA